MKVYIQPPNRPQDRALIYEGDEPVAGWPNVVTVAQQLDIPKDRILFAGGRRINGEKAYLLVVI